MTPTLATETKIHARRRSALRVPQILLVVGGMLPLISTAAPEYVEVLRAASAAAGAGESDLALAKLQEVARMRPDYPRVQINIARVAATIGKKDQSLAALERLAAMGIQLDPARDSMLASLAKDPEFLGVTKRLVDGPGIIGGEKAATIQAEGVTGIIECCAREPGTGTLYFGDVRNRCIWRSKPDGGSIEKFTHDADALDGVFRIAFSPDGRTIWASTATVEVMTGPDAQDGMRSAIVAIDAATGKVRSRHEVTRDGRKHLIGDLVVLPDGAVLATDSLSPVIWLLAPESTILQPALENDSFMSLQGITFGENPHVFYVADYSNGIWRVDFDTRKSNLLKAPPNATFFGIDGLQAIPGGFIAVQNGVNPQRILKIEYSTSGPFKATILASGLPAMTDLALGEVSDGRFRFVADSGWSLFDPRSGKSPEARTVSIISIPVE